MNAQRKIDIDPRMATNSVFMALMARLGFDANPVTPELEAQRRAIIAILKARGTPRKGRVEKRLVEGPVDFSKPLALKDGTPVKLVRSSEKTPDGDGDFWVERIDGKKLTTKQRCGWGIPHEMPIHPDGDIYHRPAHGQQVFNVEEVEVEDESEEAIDWSAPLELLDGTPVRLGNDGQWRGPSDMYPEQGLWLWITRCDGKPFTAKQRKGWDEQPGANRLDIPIRKRDGAIYLDDDFAKRGPIVRNRSLVIGKIDWAKPIEHVDGTPLMVMRNKTTGAYHTDAVGHDKQGHFWVTREDGKAEDVDGFMFSMLAREGGCCVDPANGAGRSRLIRNRVPKAAKDPSLDWTKPLVTENGDAVDYLEAVAEGTEEYDESARHSVRLHLSDGSPQKWYRDDGVHYLGITDDKHPRIRNK